MTERFLHIAVIANDGDNETAEGYILDVVDGAVQDRYVQIVLFDEVGDDRFICDVAAEGEGEDGLVVRVLFIGMDIHVGELFRYFRRHDRADEFFQSRSLRIGEKIDDGAFLDNAAMFDDGDTFSDLLDDFHLMRDHDDGDAELLIDIFQQL